MTEQCWEGSHPPIPLTSPLKLSALWPSASLYNLGNLFNLSILQPSFSPKRAPSCYVCS